MKYTAEQLKGLKTLAQKTRIDLEEGKYSILHHHGVGLRALRYGEPWRDCSGDGLILALAQEVEVLREQQAGLVRALADYVVNDSAPIELNTILRNAVAALAAVKFVG